MTLNETYRTDAPKTVLIAGGCGFLGSWLCERHLALGDRVICVDNLLTGRLSNVAGLLRHPNFTYLNHDIVHPLPVRDALAGPIDQIFNMACAASPPKYQLDPIHTFQTNIWACRTCWNWHGSRGRGSCNLRPPRCMVIPCKVRRSKTTKVTSTPMGRVPVMTKASVPQRR